MNDQAKDSFYHGKKVLIAGASGFIGSNLMIRMIDLGAKIRATSHKKRIRDVPENVEVLQCDLTKKEDCTRAAQNIDYIFMAAANSSGAQVMEKTPLVHLTPNLVMNAYMLEAAYEQNVKKLCFISSNTVYPQTDYPVKESDTNYDYFEKYFVVGWMKRFSEIMCEMYSSRIKSPMKTLVVRPGNLYGPRDKFTWNDSKVIAALVRRAVECQNPYEVWGDGMDIKDFLYIDDFIDALVEVFQREDLDQPINIASGHPVTIRQVVDEVIKCTGLKDVEVVWNHDRPTMIPKRLIDITYILNSTDWKPKVSLGEGLQRTIDWYIETFKEVTPEAMIDDHM